MSSAPQKIVRTYQISSLAPSQPDDLAVAADHFFCKTCLQSPPSGKPWSADKSSYLLCEYKKSGRAESLASALELLEPVVERAINLASVKCVGRGIRLENMGDIKQETSIKIITRIERFHCYRSGAKWAATIARNLTINHFRPRSKRKKVFFVDFENLAECGDGELHLRPTVNPWSDFEMHETYRLWENQLALLESQLTPTLYEAWMLYRELKDRKLVADSLNISQSAAASRITRSFQTLSRAARRPF